MSRSLLVHRSTERRSVVGNHSKSMGGQKPESVFLISDNQKPVRKEIHEVPVIVEKLPLALFSYVDYGYG